MRWAEFDLGQKERTKISEITWCWRIRTIIIEGRLISCKASDAFYFIRYLGHYLTITQSLSMELELLLAN